MVKEKQWKTHVMVSQVSEDGQEAVEIVKLHLMDSWERLERVLFLEADDDPEPTRPYQVWVEEITAEGDFPEVERSLAISTSDAHWLLADFFGEPKSIWSKLKHEEGLAPVAW